MIVERCLPRKVKDVDATHGAGGIRPVRDAGQTGRAPGPERFYGALDLGTNNCRLLVAMPSHSGFTVVDAFSRIVRLGENLNSTGRLGEKAIERTIEALRVCANKLKWRKVENVRLVATEACRMAQNGVEFIERVKAEIGLSLEIIDRETEAQLAAMGAEPLIAADAKTVLVFDIGGGSTEVMWMEHDGKKHVVKAWTSLAAGVVTVSEKFGGGVNVTPAVFENMRQDLRPMVGGFAQRVRAETGGNGHPDHLLGTSGTVTTIAGVLLGLPRYDRSKVDGCWLKSSEIGEVTDRLCNLGYDERAASPCIGRERADLVLAGCAILEEIRLAFPSDRIRVADRGLREGILTQLMKRDGSYGSPA